MTWCDYIMKVLNDISDCPLLECCPLHTTPWLGFLVGSQVQHGARIPGWFRGEDWAGTLSEETQNLLTVTPQGTAVAGDTQRGHLAPTVGNNWDLNVLNRTAVLGTVLRTHEALTSRVAAPS